jgi:aldose 1-epimerase
MIKPAAFGNVPAGKARLFTLASRSLRVRITDFGARMVAIEVPDHDGVFADVLLGFDRAEDYVTAGGSFGAILGRVANRVADGRFVLDGVAHQLAVNDTGGTLHGGPGGFGQRLWLLERYDKMAVTLSLLSPDGDQGFPGALLASVTYRLEGDRLRIELSATTDQPTICNLSAHPYFNLAGVAAHDMLGHEVMIAAEAFLPVDERQIPTGEICPVQETLFDFRTPKPVGTVIRQADPQLRRGRGFDHCFVLQPGAAPAARAQAGGRFVEVTTTQPG